MARKGTASPSRRGGAGRSGASPTGRCSWWFRHPTPSWWPALGPGCGEGCPRRRRRRQAAGPRGAGAACPARLWRQHRGVAVRPRADAGVRAPRGVPAADCLGDDLLARGSHARPSRRAAGAAGRRARRRHPPRPRRRLRRLVGTEPAECGVPAPVLGIVDIHDAGRDAGCRQDTIFRHLPAIDGSRLPRHDLPPFGSPGVGLEVYSAGSPGLRAAPPPCGLLGDGRADATRLVLVDVYAGAGVGVGMVAAALSEELPLRLRAGVAMDVNRVAAIRRAAQNSIWRPGRSVRSD